MGVSVRGTCGHPIECPTVPWDHGTMGWEGQWDTHASVEGQVDIPWNVPLSHGTVGWDGQFTAFLDLQMPCPFYMSLVKFLYQQLLQW